MHAKLHPNSDIPKKILCFLILPKIKAIRRKNNRLTSRNILWHYKRKSLSLRHKGVNQTMFDSHLFYSHLFPPNQIKIKNTLSAFPLSNIDKPTHLFNATALLNQIGMNVEIQCSRNVRMPEYCTHRLVVALALYATRRKGVAKSMKNNRRNL